MSYGSPMCPLPHPPSRVGGHVAINELASEAGLPGGGAIKP